MRLKPLGHLSYKYDEYELSKYSFNVSRQGRIKFKPLSLSFLFKRFSEFADKQKFVEFLGKSHLPDIKMTSHTNRCMIGIESDHSRQNWVIVSSLDNLIKGAAGQAIQNMNIMFGLEESLGLE